MPHRHPSSRPHGGWTLLELLVTIIVVAVLTAGVLLLYRQATSAADTTQAEDLLTSIQAAVHELYADEDGYRGLDGQVLRSGGLAADRRDPWGGAIHVRSSAGGHHFTISFHRVPHGACLRLGNAPTSAEWTSLRIDGVNVYDGTTPPEPAAVLSACRSAPYDRITWTSS
jgi:prepilin-type N-terminal cleavage/methylation domain-containing protein